MTSDKTQRDAINNQRFKRYLRSRLSGTVA